MGLEIEIISFLDLFEISIKILYTEFDHETMYTGNSNSLQLTLLFNGPYDSGHIDIFE